MIGVILLLLVSTPAFGQGSRQDYDRAASLGRRTSGGVLNEKIKPNWIGKTGSLWYVRQISTSESQYILVDADRRERRPLFDHDVVAGNLAKLLDRQVSAKRLPIDALTIPALDRLATLTSRGRQFSLDLQTGDLSPVRAVAKPEPAEQGPNRIAIRPSRLSDAETAITFVNRSGQTVQVLWIDLEGRRQSYGELAPNDTRRQETYAGHKWLVVDRQGRPMATFSAAREELRAVIEPAPAAAPRPEGSGPQGNRPPSVDQDDPADSGDVEDVAPDSTVRERPSGRRRDGGRDASPDRRYAAFIRDHNVFVRDTESGQEIRLSNNGVDGDAYQPSFRWSPDSSRLVVLQVKRAEVRQVHIVESSPRDQVQPKLLTFDYAKPGDPLDRPRPRLFDVAARSQIAVAEDLYDNPWRISDIRWARDSSRFTFVYNQRGHQVLRTVAVSRDGKAGTLFEETSKTFIDYSGKYFCQWLDNGGGEGDNGKHTDGQILWMSERDGWNHLYLIDGKTGEVSKQLTRGQWVVRRVDRVDLDRRQVWFTAMGIHPGQDPYYQHLCRVNLDGSGLVVLTRADGDHQWEFSPDGKVLLVTWSRVDQPPVVELRNADDGKLVCEVERADASGLERAGWTIPKRFVAKGRDGETDIHGIIVLPSTFDPQKKYPVVEQIYAGPHDFFTPKSFGRQSMHHRIAELGFIVVQMDGMGTNWRSRAFHDVCWQNLADGGFPDRIAWIKAAAKEIPQMDLTRVGIFGGSAGGQNALAAMLHHGDFYKVAVADCGCHDNRMDKVWWNEAWMGWPVGEAYERSSNVAHAKNLKGKLMLIVGELDRNVDPASTMQVVNALIRADKDFDHVIIPGAGHGAAETPYGSRRRADFLVRHLHGVEPRWEE